MRIDPQLEAELTLLKTRLKTAQAEISSLQAQLRSRKESREQLARILFPEDHQ